MNAILHNLHVRVELPADKSLYLRQSLLGALVRVTSLINTADADAILHQRLL